MVNWWVLVLVAIGKPVAPERRGCSAVYNRYTLSYAHTYTRSPPTRFEQVCRACVCVCALVVRAPCGSRVVHHSQPHQHTRACRSTEMLAAVSASASSFSSLSRGLLAAPTRPVPWRAEPSSWRGYCSPRKRFLSAFLSSLESLL